MKHPMILCLLTVFAATGVHLSSASAQCEYTIGGTVYADCDEPLTTGLQDVQVCVDCGDFNECDMTSGGWGGWMIEGVPCGSCTVTLEKEGSAFCYVTDVCPPDPCEHPIDITVDADHQAENMSLGFWAYAGSTCGNEVCEAGEDSVDCCEDCGSVCGDGVCNCDEPADPCVCPLDCGLPPPNQDCDQDGICDPDDPDDDNDGDPDISDCADCDASIHHAATENCTDGMDNDCDGLNNCDDPDCVGIPPCGPTFDDCGFLFQGVECVLFQADGGGLYYLDNYEGFVVGQRVHVAGILDQGCANFCMQGDGCIHNNTISACQCPPGQDCDGDGLCDDQDPDDDNDGDPDSSDCADCDASIHHGATEDCTDVIDNDCDGDTDCDDGDCASHCVCQGGDPDGDGVCDDVDNCPNTYNPDQENCDSDCQGNACDSDDDNDGDPDSSDCEDCDASIHHEATENCIDGIDNDCDGNSDCDDGDCASQCICQGGDPDGDGVCSDVDNCPNVYNPGQEDTDGDGVPGLCGDECPFDPNKIHHGLCDCGTPDTDSDNDGTPDCNDGCPSDPNKTGPGVCGCGTPDTDSDNDGTPDCYDGCPSDANKLVPGFCGCGRPDSLSDVDDDGVIDCFDNCPSLPNPDQADSDSDGIGDPCDTPTGLPTGVCGCGPGTGLAVPFLIVSWFYLKGSHSRRRRRGPHCAR